MVVSSMISVPTGLYPHANIPTFSLPMPQKLDKLVDTTYGRSRPFVTLSPRWPLPETAWNLRQPPLRHSVDGSKQPILPNGKILHYPYPTEGHICTQRSTMAMARFASSTTDHCSIQCDQYCARTTLVWPTQAYLNYSLGAHVGPCLVSWISLQLCYA